MSGSELWPVVDNQDRVIRYATEDECHDKANPLIHRTVFVGGFEIGEEGEEKIVLQQRSLSKSLYPGAWTLSATGHVIMDEKYTEAACRELEEELGVTPDSQLSIVITTKLDIPEHPSFSALFRTNIHGPYNFNPEEVAQVAAYSMDQLQRLANELTPPSRLILKKAGWIR